MKRFDNIEIDDKIIWYDDFGEYKSWNDNQLQNFLNESDRKIESLKKENEKLKKCYQSVLYKIGTVVEENEQLKEKYKDAWNLIEFIYYDIKENGSMDWGEIQDLIDIEVEED